MLVHNPNDPACDEVVVLGMELLTALCAAETALRESAFNARAATLRRSSCKGLHSTAMGGRPISHNSRTVSSDGCLTPECRGRPPHGMPRPRRRHGPAAANPVRSCTSVRTERPPLQQRGARRCATWLALRLALSTRTQRQQFADGKVSDKLRPRTSRLFTDCLSRLRHLGQKIHPVSSRCSTPSDAVHSVVS